MRKVPERKPGRLTRTVIASASLVAKGRIDRPEGGSLVEVTPPPPARLGVASMEPTCPQKREARSRAPAGKLPAARSGTL